jgi:hypothetical protein
MVDSSRFSMQNAVLYAGVPKPTLTCQAISVREKFLKSERSFAI